MHTQINPLLASTTCTCVTRSSSQSSQTEGNVELADYLSNTAMYCIGCIQGDV